MTIFATPITKKMKRLLLTLLAILFLVPAELSAQKLSSEQFIPIADSLQKFFKTSAFVVGKITLVRADKSGNTISLQFSTPLSEYPFREENVKETYAIARALMPEEYKNSALKIYSNRSLIEEFIPPFYRTITVRTTDEVVPAGKKVKKSAKAEKNIKPEKNLVRKESSLSHPVSGLQNKHLAIWQSHGYYYEQKLLRWEWQRARIFQTVEDLYTQSYVLPFLVPMLENAGANVLLPRERDIQLNEYIIDNDMAAGGYSEVSGEKRWNSSDSAGFAHTKEVYVTGENPFRMGTAREVKSISKGEESMAKWTPAIRDNGDYAVYVSYQSFPKSTDNARYTVKHAGGVSHFSVNQRMGGGTWIYLGTFGFRKDSDHFVMLTNNTGLSGDIVSADAVKIGGGMGNIARKPAEEGSLLNRPSSSSEPVSKVKIGIDVNPLTSGYPRFTEGARYWLQWAGFSDILYTPNKNSNDYNDDYMSRGKWVNVMSGGSARNPEEKGLRIPLDMAFAFHTDAGTTLNDSIVGTLGIYTRFSNDSDKFPDGGERINSRYLTDLIQTQIVDDIKAKYEPIWQRRGIWDRSYAESRTPVVPTMLLELLSHQNLADMRYGLDPEFRFTVSRAIYKGILKFFAHKDGVPYVVQPLPVYEFSATLHDGVALLRWKGVNDTLEPTAVPDKYIVYTRTGDGAFDNGRVVQGNSLAVDIEKDKIYSFKVTAVNKGGESFPSEILSVYNALNEKGKVLIVNGFTKISAAASFATKDTTMGGFADYDDYGVPYINDISYIGSQYEFRRSIPWMDDDSPGFGASYADYETRVIAGNTFDYPYVHGKAFAKAGYSFVSASRASVENGIIDMRGYKIVDLIMGKQKQYKMGRGVTPVKFGVFTPELMKAVESYTQAGGNLLISGSYIATDVWDSIENNPETQNFVKRVLRYQWRTDHASKTGFVKAVQSPYNFNGAFSFHTKPNEYSYSSESPDGIEPVGENAWTIYRYSDNNISAGVAYKGAYKTVSLGFPLETLRNESEIDSLVKIITDFFSTTENKIQQ